MKIMTKYVLHENCIYTGTNWERHAASFLDLEKCEDLFEEDRVIVDALAAIWEVKKKLEIN